MGNSRYGLDDRTLDRMKQVFAAHENIDDIIIYGSRAEGNYRPGSDIDISLKGEKLTLRDLNLIERELDELDLPYKLDVSIYHQIDNPELVEHIDRVGVRFLQWSMGDTQ